MTGISPRKEDRSARKVITIAIAPPRRVPLSINPKADMTTNARTYHIQDKSIFTVFWSFTFFSPHNYIVPFVPFLGKCYFSHNSYRVVTFVYYVMVFLVEAVITSPYYFCVNERPVIHAPVENTSTDFAFY